MEVLLSVGAISITPLFAEVPSYHSRVIRVMFQLLYTAVTPEVVIS